MLKPHLNLQNVKKSDFPLPTLGPKLVSFRDEAVEGRGFVLLRGLPVDQWPVEEIATAYWGIGAYWGKDQPQNILHHLLGHVKVSAIGMAKLLPSCCISQQQLLFCLFRPRGTRLPMLPILVPVKKNMVFVGCKLV